MNDGWMNERTIKLLDKGPRVTVRTHWATTRPRPATTWPRKESKPSIHPSIHHQLRVRTPSEYSGGRSNEIPQPTSCGTYPYPSYLVTLSLCPFLGSIGDSTPLGSRSRREPETSSTAKTPRRKQNRNTASSKSLFLSASKINTSQNQQSIGPRLPSAPPAEGAATRQPGLVRRISLHPVSQPQNHTWCNCHLLQLMQAADGADNTTNQQQASPLPPPPSPPALRPRGILVGGLKQIWEEKSQLVEMRLCKHITS